MARSKRIKVTLTDAELEALKKLAKDKGLTLSALARLKIKQPERPDR